MTAPGRSVNVRLSNERIVPAEKIILLVEENEGIRLVKKPGEAGRSAEFFGPDAGGEQGWAAPAGPLDILADNAGTGLGESEPGVPIALAGVNGISCVIVGHDRRAAQGPPVVVVIDTPGAAGSARAVGRARADPRPENVPGSGHRWHQVVSIASMTAPSSVRT